MALEMNGKPLFKELHRKGKYAFWALVQHARSESPCPSCGGKKGHIVGRAKTLFLARRCSDCGLVYRNPIELVPEFYQSNYHEYSNWRQAYKNGRLQQGLDREFRDTEWDYYDKLSLIKAIKPEGKLLDFGGGSGIIGWQLKQIGFDLTLFEIASELQDISVGMFGLHAISEFADLENTADGSYDVIFSHHVLEHVPNLPPVFATFHRLLKDDGLLAAFVPNREAYMYKDDPAATIDSAHVSAFDAFFFSKNLERFGFEGRVISSPYAFSDDKSGEETRLAKGMELLLLAWKIGQPPPPQLQKWPYDLPDLRHSRRAQAGC